MAPLDRSHTSSYSSSIVTMAVPCTIFEIKRDIGRKTSIFHTSLYLTCTIPELLIFAKILIQIVRVTELLGGVKIAEKF